MNGVYTIFSRDEAQLTGTNKCGARTLDLPTFEIRWDDASPRANQILSCKSDVEVRPPHWGVMCSGAVLHTSSTEIESEVPVALRYILGYSQQTSVKSFIVGKIELQELGNRTVLFICIT